jgi:hypothetical protein
MKAYKRFTESERNIVRSNYQLVGIGGTMRLMPGRDKQAIFALAHRLGVTTPRKREAGIRFWSKVNKTSGVFGEDDWYDFGECWIWIGGSFSNGYGQFKMPDSNKKIYAHRYAYLDIIGTIPDGYVLDHLCRTRACVNPTHLQPVLPVVNILRGHLKYTHCPYGHVRSHYNTIYQDKKIYCKSCMGTRDICFEQELLADRQNPNFYTKYMEFAK